MAVGARQRPRRLDHGTGNNLRRLAPVRSHRRGPGLAPAGTRGIPGQRGPVGQGEDRLLPPSGGAGHGTASAAQTAPGTRQIFSARHPRGRERPAQISASRGSSTTWTSISENTRHTGREPLPCANCPPTTSPASAPANLRRKLTTITPSGPAKSASMKHQAGTVTSQPHLVVVSGSTGDSVIDGLGKKATRLTPGLFPWGNHRRRHPDVGLGNSRPVTGYSLTLASACQSRSSSMYSPVRRRATS